MVTIYVPRSLRFKCIKDLDNVTGLNRPLDLSGEKGIPTQLPSFAIPNRLFQEEAAGKPFRNTA
jgi:hypothetical protein